MRGVYKMKTKSKFICECCGEQRIRFKVAEAHGGKKVCLKCFNSEYCGPDGHYEGDDDE